MGTPAFAAPALDALINSKHEVVAVYTNPPRESGRGQRLNKSIIHMIAEENGLPVFTPLKLTAADAIAEFDAIDADIVVVAAYGKILRKPILEGKKHGCINIHPSKLPQWRGAAPLQRTIMSGDATSALCIMQMDEGMDTGDILLQEDFDIPESMTIKELHDYAAELGGAKLLDALDIIESGNAKPLSQEGDVTYAEKLTAEDEVIDWSNSARDINCQIRALSPRPGAYFIYKRTKIKIITASYDLSINSGESPGTVLDEHLTIQCGEGVLKPDLIQREGKKMVYIDAFLRGFKVEGKL